MYNPSEMPDGPEFQYTDDELVQLVEREINRSSNDYSSGVTAQREEAYRYYYGQPFGNERPGFSRHVSMEVFESIEDIKAELLNTFCSGPQVLRFTEEADNDQAGARDATDYVHSLFYDQNAGYNILHDVIHDGLVAKLGTVKACWYERVRASKETFSDVPVEQLQVLFSDPQVVDWGVDDERDEQGIMNTPTGPQPVMRRLASGWVTKREEVGEVRVEAVAPENVIISHNATDPREADIVVVVYPDKLIGELAAEGYDPEVLKTLRRTHDTLDNSRSARHSFDSSWNFHAREGEDERATVDLREAYVDLDMDGDGVPEVWKLTIAGNTLLDKEQIAGKPLHFWTPYRIPHKAIGLSAADITTSIQRTNSGLVRGVVDNVFMTNTSMKIADLSLIRNPRDLIDNPIGAVIDSPDPQAVQAVAQPQLNPGTFNAIGLMLEQKQGRIGLSKLPAQQVVSHQNSEDMINKLMSEGQKRITMMARGFAEGFLKPLFLQLYNLGVEYGQVVGAETEIGFRVLDPRTFKPQRHRMKIAVALTSDERAKRASALSHTYGMLREDPQMAPLFGVEEKFALLTDYFEAIGTGSPRYLKNPNSPAGQRAIQQASQVAQQEQQAQRQVMEQQMALVQGEMQLKMQKTQAEVQEILHKLKLQEEKQMAEGLIAGREQELAEEKFEWNQEIAEKELALERQQNRNVVVRSGGKG